MRRGQWRPTVRDAVEERKERAYYVEYRRECWSAETWWAVAVLSGVMIGLAITITLLGAKVERMAAAMERLAPVADVAARFAGACANADAGKESEAEK